jgi:hypothetical protein
MSRARQAGPAATNPAALEVFCEFGLLPVERADFTNNVGTNDQFRHAVIEIVVRIATANGAADVSIRSPGSTGKAVRTVVAPSDNRLLAANDTPRGGGGNQSARPIRHLPIISIEHRDPFIMSLRVGRLAWPAP